MKQTYPFDLMPLPYDYDALEPYMDAETLHYHHDKHLKTYVDNLNNIFKGLSPVSGLDTGRFYSQIWTICRKISARQ